MQARPFYFVIVMPNAGTAPFTFTYAFIYRFLSRQKGPLPVVNSQSIIQKIDRKIARGQFCGRL